VESSGLSRTQKRRRSLQSSPPPLPPLPAFISNSERQRQGQVFSSKKTVNIFTDSLLVSGKRRWKPTEKVMSAEKKHGHGLWLQSESTRSQPETHTILEHPSRGQKASTLATQATQPLRNTQVTEKPSALHASDAHKSNEAIETSGSSFDTTPNGETMDDKSVTSTCLSSSEALAKTSSVSSSVSPSHPPHKKTAHPLAKKFTLDEKVLMALKDPDAQVRFCAAIQGSLTSDDVRPPRLILSSTSQRIVSPAGAALLPAGSSKRSKSRKGGSPLSGNIVCGICGIVAHFKSIFLAKRMGTFSCDPCRKFIECQIRDVGLKDQALKCRLNDGKCVLGPSGSQPSLLRRVLLFPQSHSHTSSTNVSPMTGSKSLLK
ncbi:Histonelysine Nmethyltransferase 2Alike, partial [Caligus rogercresseyi]